MAKSKEEKAAYQKAWRESNKERHAANNKAWYLANKEKHATYVKAWHLSNKEKHAASRMAYLLRLNLENKNISKRTLRAWSTQVKARDCACLYCGSTKKLNAHHILSKSKHPDHALFLSNGITLC
jgi:5-methylcytosine-specific restriction endonuclease McrA